MNPRRPRTSTSLRTEARTLAEPCASAFSRTRLAFSTHKCDRQPRSSEGTLTNLYNERRQWLKLAHEKLHRAVLADYAATNPEGNWCDDWASVWVDSGAGQPLPDNHPLLSERRRVDQLVLANLPRLNWARSGG